MPSWSVGLRVLPCSRALCPWMLSRVPAVPGEFAQGGFGSRERLLRAQGFSEAPPARVLGLDRPPGILSWLISWNFLSFRFCLGSAATNPDSHRQPSWGLAPEGNRASGARTVLPSTLLLQPPFLRQSQGWEGWKRRDTLPSLEAPFAHIPPWVRAAGAAVQGLLGRSSLGLWGLSPPRSSPGCRDALAQAQDQTASELLWGLKKSSETGLLAPQPGCDAS